MCTVVLWTKVVIEVASIERIAAIKKRKENAMRAALVANIVFLVLLIFQILFRIQLVSVRKCY